MSSEDRKEFAASQVRRIRETLVAEISDARPSLNIVQYLVSALQDALKREGKLSLDEATDAQSTLRSRYTISHGTAVGLNDYSDSDDDLGPPVRRRETRDDQMLAAISQMAQGQMRDPLMDLLAVLPQVERLYTTEEANKLRTELRSLVEARKNKILAATGKSVESPENQCSVLAAIEENAE